MNSGANFETSMVVPLGVLVALVKRQTDQGSSKSGTFVGRPFTSTFLSFILAC